MRSATLSMVVSTAPTIQRFRSGSGEKHLVTKFSGSSFTLDTGGTVVTDSLEELALNLFK